MSHDTDGVITVTRPRRNPFVNDDHHYMLMLICYRLSFSKQVGVRNRFSFLLLGWVPVGSQPALVAKPIHTKKVLLFRESESMFETCLLVVQSKNRVPMAPPTLLRRGFLERIRRVASRNRRLMARKFWGCPATKSNQLISKLGQQSLEARMLWRTPILLRCTMSVLSRP